jgi:hypothetical protein
MATLKFKLGKKPVRFDDRTLHFGTYLTSELPPPPASKDYTKKVTPPWPMMGNDAYGDCTCAAAGHMIQEWRANTGHEEVLPVSAILKVYDHFSPNNPDGGANMLDVLKYWRTTGIGSDRISAFVQLEPKNDMQVRDAINLFGNCYIGVALPDFAVVPGSNFLTTPWVVPSKGAVGNAAPNPQNGHCIPAVAYDERNLYVVTWGALKSMSWQFYDAYLEESYAVLSDDWIGKKVGVSPSGFDMTALNRDLAAIAGGQAAAATR